MNPSDQAESHLLALLRDVFPLDDVSTFYGTISPDNLLSHIQSKVHQGNTFLGLRVVSESDSSIDTVGVMSLFTLDIDVMVVSNAMKEKALPNSGRMTNQICRNVKVAVVGTEIEILDNPPRTPRAVSKTDLFRDGGVDAQILKFRIEGLVDDLGQEPEPYFGVRLTDDEGNFLVDNLGNFLIVG